MSKIELLEGTDVDIETSLCEYGIAWIIEKEETRFYYGIEHDGKSYVRFDHCSFPNNLDVFKEFDWVEFDQIFSFLGCNREEFLGMPLTQNIADLVSYYGYENVFGSSYDEGMTYEEVTK